MSAADDLAVPASVTIRTLDTLEEVVRASDLFSEVWGGDRDPMPSALMRALAHAGNYVVGLYDGEQMIGASVAFFAAPASRTMHSHVTGILGEYQGQGLGRVLKQHQRSWALRRDVGHITWTYDPLVARNAHFNLRLLGARATEYLVNQYGAMYDGVNLGGESDRIMAAWALASFFWIRWLIAAFFTRKLALRANWQFRQGLAPLCLCQRLTGRGAPAIGRACPTEICRCGPAAAVAQW